MALFKRNDNKDQAAEDLAENHAEGMTEDLTESQPEDTPSTDPTSRKRFGKPKRKSKPKRNLRGVVRIEELEQALADQDLDDIDPDAVALSRHNAELAEVDDIVKFEVGDATRFHWGGLYGRIVTNPPYGERLLEREEAGELYRAFGRAMDKLPDNPRCKKDSA